MGHHFGLLSPVGYLAQSGPNLTFGLLKAHVFYGLEIFTPVNGLFVGSKVCLEGGVIRLLDQIKI